MIRLKNPIQEEAAAPLTFEVVITSAVVSSAKRNKKNLKRLKIAKNGNLTLDFEIRDLDGNVIPIGTADPDDDSGHFAVPVVDAVSGSSARTIPVDFVAGIASIDIPWTQSGEFEITEDLINMNIPPEDNTYFKFDGLAFSSYG